MGRPIGSKNRPQAPAYTALVQKEREQRRLRNLKEQENTNTLNNTREPDSTPPITSKSTIAETDNPIEIAGSQRFEEVLRQRLCHAMALAVGDDDASLAALASQKPESLLRMIDKLSAMVNGNGVTHVHFRLVCSEPPFDWDRGRAEGMARHSVEHSSECVPIPASET